MSRRARRKFTAIFKTEVVLEALKERKSISAPTQQFDLHPDQISVWKKEFLAGTSKVPQEPGDRERESLEQERDQLLRQIGKLQVENDFQKNEWWGIPRRSVSGGPGLCIAQARTAPVRVAHRRTHRSVAPVRICQRPPPQDGRFGW